METAIMKYFAIQFPNSTSFIVKTNSSWTLRELVIEIQGSSGLETLGGFVFNPSQFISVNSISSPDERQKKVAKDLEKVLF